MKTIIPDTNALINYPEILDNAEFDYIILDCVLRELNKLEIKKFDRELQYKLRITKKILNKLIVEQKSKHIKFYEAKDLTPYEACEYVDDVIVRCAEKLSETIPNIEVITDDTLLKIKLQLTNVGIVDITEDLIYYDKFDPIYTIKDNEANLELLSTIYQENDLPRDSKARNKNYITIVDSNNKPKDLLKYSNEFGIEPINYKMIRGTHNLEVIQPRNIRQKFAFDLLQDRSKLIKLITGGQGSGKTFMMVNHAVDRMVKENKKIVWIRNNVDVRGVRELGALPGDTFDKILPYTKVIIDILGQEKFDEYYSKGLIEIEHLGFVRGRSFENAIILCSEAQNLSREHIKLLLGRTGADSEIWFDGDSLQSDINNLSGLKALDSLQGQRVFGKVELNEIERSQVARIAETMLV